MEDYRAIRLACLLTAPEAFGSAYEIEATRPMGSFAERLESSIVFGAYAGGRILGMTGFKQESAPKERHKGFIWGVYVEPSARGQGVAAALLAAIIDAAQAIVEQLTLTVVQGNDAAMALYQKLGFETYGIEPRARKTVDGYQDKVLMARALRPS